MIINIKNGEWICGITPVDYNLQLLAGKLLINIALEDGSIHSIEYQQTQPTVIEQDIEYFISASTDSQLIFCPY